MGSTRGLKPSIEKRRLQRRAFEIFLHALRQSGVKMCVATATDRPLAEAALRRTGLLSYFSFLLTCTEAGFGKDSPDIFCIGTEKTGHTAGTDGGL